MTVIMKETNTYFASGEMFFFSNGVQVFAFDFLFLKIYFKKVRRDQVHRNKHAVLNNAE